jgi:hypothetical protein
LTSSDEQRRALPGQAAKPIDQERIHMNTKKMWRAALINLLLLSVIWLATGRDVAFVQWPLIIVVWSMCMLYFWELFAPFAPSPLTDPLPIGLSPVLDLACIYLLVHADWYWTATVYALSALALFAIYRRDRDKAAIH